MKKFIFISFVAAALVSCSKSNDNIIQREDQKIEFNLYGATKTYVQINAGVSQSGSLKTYTFVGTKNPSAENIFSISFQTDSLRPGSYNLNNGVISFREGSKVITNVSSQSFTLVISSNVNGLINGSFAGTLYDLSTSSNCTVSQGVIENVQY